MLSACLKLSAVTEEQRVGPVNLMVRIVRLYAKMPGNSPPPLALDSSRVTSQERLATKKSAKLIAVPAKANLNVV